MSVERLRNGPAPFLLYPLLALLAFPVLGHLMFGEAAIAYALDVFELPRTGMGLDWLANGMTLWNTHITAGNALFAQQTNTPLAVDVLLEPLVGPFAAYVVMLWLAAVVAGIGMHLFLRDSLRLPTAAIVVGSVLYLFGFWHYIYGLSVPAIPLLLWLMDRAVRPSPTRWRYAIAGVGASAFVLYHGLSQILLFAAVLQLAWLMTSASDRRDAASRVALWAATWGIALAIHGPVITTLLVMLPISNRAAWDVAQLRELGSAETVVTALRSYVATLVAVPIGGGVGASPGRYGTFFAGVLGVGLIALAIVWTPRDRRRWFVLALLVIVPALDILATLAEPVQAQLGFLRSFQLVRVRHLYPFVLAVAAALGVEVLVSLAAAGRPRPSPDRRRAVLGLLVLVPVAVTIAATLAGVVRTGTGVADGDPAAVGWALLFAALVVGGMLVAGAAWLAGGGSPRDGRGLAGVLLLAVALAVSGERAAWTWGERLVDVPSYRGTWAATRGDTPAKRFLRAQPGIDVERILSFGGRPNQVAAAEMLQVDGYQSLYPVTYKGFFAALIAPALVDDPFHSAYVAAWGNRLVTFGPEVDPELAALAGTRWLLVHDGSTPTVPGIVERFRDPSGTVYEVPSVLPRAFIAGRVDIHPDEATLLAAMGNADRSTLGATAFVTDGPEADRLSAAVPATVADAAADTDAGAGTATIREYTPDRVVVDVAATAPGVLVLTDVMAPGWTADRDGVDIPIATVDATFRGVPVDAGTRELVFRYRPSFTYAGFALGGVGLVLALVLGIAVRRVDHRRRMGLDE